jgi:rhodanese-related sulfurtransferase
MRKSTFLLVGALLVFPVLASCASGTTTQEPVPVMSNNSTATIIDVRTPAEFADGRVEGAVNIDVQSADFEASLANLDKNAEYIVYCRSGNRSAIAVQIMADAGITKVVDLGDLQSAATSLGRPIVN